MNKKYMSLFFLLIRLDQVEASSLKDELLVVSLLHKEFDPFVHPGAELPVLANNFLLVVSNQIANGDELTTKQGGKKETTESQQSDYPKQQAKKMCFYIVCAVVVPFCLAAGGYVAATFS